MTIQYIAVISYVVVVFRVRFFRFATLRTEERIKQLLVPPRELQSAILYIEAFKLKRLKTFESVEQSTKLEGGGRGYSPISAILVCAAPKGMVFEPFWSENGYKFGPLRSEIGCGWKNVLIFLTQKNKRERKNN